MDTVLCNGSSKYIYSYYLRVIGCATRTANPEIFPDRLQKPKAVLKLARVACGRVHVVAKGRERHVGGVHLTPTPGVGFVLPSLLLFVADRCDGSGAPDGCEDRGVGLATATEAQLDHLRARRGKCPERWLDVAHFVAGGKRLDIIFIIVSRRVGKYRSRWV